MFSLINVYLYLAVTHFQYKASTCKFDFDMGGDYCKSIGHGPMPVVGCQRCPNNSLNSVASATCSNTVS